MDPQTSARAQVRQHADRSVPDDAAEIFGLGLVAHVGFAIDGQPFVIPFTYHFDPSAPGRLYLHGSPTSRALQHLAGGAPVCVEVSLLDGLVYSRTALYHSMNYRSAVCFGRAREVVDEAEQRSVFEKMIGRYFAGRTAPRDYEAPSAEHLDATTLLRLEIEEMSAKARRGGPKGPLDSDPDAPGTAGVVDPGGEPPHG